MKVKANKLREAPQKLYIPHGSDESRPAFLVLIILINFISHMVQMKVVSDVDVDVFFASFISHMVQMKVR